MLKHTLEFVETHRCLGRASEAQIESYHAQFNLRYNHNHRNLSHQPADRQRRVLADTALQAVQPHITAKC